MEDPPARPSAYDGLTFRLSFGSGVESVKADSASIFGFSTGWARNYEPERDREQHTHARRKRRTLHLGRVTEIEIKVRQQHNTEMGYSQTMVEEVTTEEQILPEEVEKLIKHACFTDAYDASVEIIRIPHPYSEEATLECIHYPARPTHHSNTSPLKKPILFVHGAFHGAWCFGLLQQYYQSRGIDTYAISLRNHGTSFKSNWAAATHIGHLAYDVEVAVRHLFGEEKDIDGEKVQTVRPYILVGHSVGGAVVQRFVSYHSHPTLWNTPACILPACLVTLFAFSPVSPQVTWMRNWWNLHPWAFINAFFRIRPKCVFDGPELVRDGFFTEKTPQPIVDACQARLEEDESLAFMIDLTFQPVFYAGPRAAQKLGTDSNSPLRNKIIVMGATEDKIITKEIWDLAAQTYGQEAVVVDGVGHNGFLDLQWEKVAMELEENIVEALRQTGSQRRE
ncbi:hypothetical protein PROFUN_02610 [Planoprotostelium fungivorum]|uniref:AB hydrolase-1 domain-containing protein n=1 Tax=Planoprotostelium fungivorum TaxID=1890364 RepID=A0A2P6NV87_9EUKA|nr:hypothetical protein PROFUN_02610 [Planoprotostelium fungivorum]